VGVATLGVREMILVRKMNYKFSTPYGYFIHRKFLAENYTTVIKVFL
jgi:hypothetical protein